MFSANLPPALIMIIGGLLLPFMPRAGIRNIFVILLPILTLMQVWQVDPSRTFSTNFVGFDIFPLTVHPFTHIFASAFSLAAFAGGLFALGRNRITEMAAAYIYAGCAIGATFAGDFLSMFIYWEIMAITSTIVVLHGASEKASGAALHYAIMHFIGGAIFLAGIAAYYNQTGSMLLSQFSVEWAEIPMILQDTEIFAKWMIFTAILINLAAAPFSSWLSSAYPEASPTGSVFLSAFTTKTAVFVMLTLFPANNILIPIGMFMIFYGIIYAMLENNIRRILSFSIINQVGFMVVGIGIGSNLALYGVAAHAFCHIMYKALLFMSAGSVTYMTGKEKCSEVGGLYHSMKLTMICGIVGALAISAFPWTSGFVSKSLISSAAGEAEMFYVWLGLLAASAGVFLHAGIKFPWFVFFHRDSGLRPEDPPLNMRVAMLFLSAMCILPALFPEYLYAMLPTLEIGGVDYQAYTPEHIVNQLQLLLFSGLAFFVFIQFTKIMERTESISLTFDWVYRVPLKWLTLMIEKAGIGIVDACKFFGIQAFRNLRALIYSYHGPRAILARNWAISSTVLYAAALLGLFLIVYYYSGG